MQSGPILYHMLYHTLLMQIYNGVYLYGDYLPPFAQLCKQHHVSLVTVRKAIQLLEQSGYIEYRDNKHYVVVYQKPGQVFEEHDVNQMVAKRKAIVELYDAIIILMPNIFVQGARLCKQDDLKQLKKICDSIDPWKLPLRKISKIAASFCVTALAPLHNRLLTDFYMRYNKFFVIPHISGQRLLNELENSYVKARPRLSFFCNS